MISLILYGRNDNHGYNLHKRAAISLNAMAEVLADPDDEILFVDYNTPDDLPTFLEAIADTLTPKARAMLRVLRVRPAVHARFQGKTHLVALESIARNIALRRSNPANRWVLSTNTDMIFVPHEPGASLSDLVRALPDGFYQLPRFELPESLWESYDRRDGAGLIARTREDARRFHLNEIVYGSDSVLYDGPGDFQLCLRDDLFAMHGFHEGMLRGWHVDANLCVRMIALRGEIRSLADRLFGYHCDHTRQVTPSHGHDRIENDVLVFLDPKQPPAIAAQAKDWGLPDVRIEEIRLGRGDVFARYLEGLKSAITASQDEVYESAYRPESYGGLTYRAAHVLPFVLDLITAYPPGAKLAYIGARGDMGASIAAACGAVAGAPKVLAPAEFTWLSGVGGLTSTPLDAVLAQADLFIFEFGAGEPGAVADAMARERLAAARRALIATAAQERARHAKGLPRRRVLAINAIHNEFESLAASLLAYTLTPFSSRVRHGYVLIEQTSAAVPADARVVWKDVQRRLERTRTMPPWETQELASQARSLAVAGQKPFPPEVLANAPALIALLRHEHVEIACGVPRSQARAIADRLELAHPGEGVRRRLYRRYGAPQRDPHLLALSRIADVRDWEKPSFAHFVDQYFGGAGGYAGPERNLWTWERASALDVLAEAELLKPDARFLVAACAPEPAAAALRDYSDHVEAARVLGGAGAFFSAAADPDEDIERGVAGWSGESDASYDAVIVLQNAMMRGGPGAVPGAFAEAAGLLKPGGLLLFSADVALLGLARPTEFDAGPIIGGAFEAAWRAQPAAFEFCGPLEAGLSPEAFNRTIDLVRADLRYRRLLELRLDGVGTAAVLSFRRTEAPASAGNLDALKHVVAVGAGGALRYQAWRGVYLAKRLERRVRREMDKRRGA